MSNEEIPLSLAAYEKACIERALTEANGNRIEAARLLKIGKSTLYRKLRLHDLSLPVREIKPASHPDREPVREIVPKPPPSPPTSKGPF